MNKLDKYKELMAVLNKQNTPIYSDPKFTPIEQEQPEMNMTPIDGSYLAPEDTARQPQLEEIQPEESASQEEVDIANQAKSQMDEYFKKVGAGQVPMPGITLGQDTDETNVQSAEDVKSLMPDSRQIAGEIQNQMQTSTPEQLNANAQESLPKELSPYEKLIQEYKAAMEQSTKDIDLGYEKDREALQSQRMWNSIGNIISNSASAGGQFLTGPSKFEFKPIDTKYGEQAKEKSKNKLDTYKELMSQLRSTGNSTDPRPIIREVDGKVQLVKVVNGVPSLTPIGEVEFNKKEKAKFDATVQANEDKNNRGIVSAELRKESLGITKDKLDFDKQQKDELTKEERTALSGYDKVYTNLDNIEQLLPKVEKMLGRYSSKAEGIKPWIGMEKDPNFAQFEALIGDNLAKYIKEISGTAASDMERAFLMTIMPKVGDTPQELKQKLNSMKQSIAKASLLDSMYISQGKELPKDVISRASAMFKFPLKIRNPSLGKSGQVSNIQELTEAVKEGFSPIQ